MLILNKNCQIFRTRISHVICYLQAELQRLNIYSLYPITEELLNLLQWSFLLATDKQGKEILEKISRSYEQRQDFRSQNLCFKTLLQPGKLFFNFLISIHFMWLDENPMLYIIDTYTGLQNATALRCNAVNDV